MVLKISVCKLLSGLAVGLLCFLLSACTETPQNSSPGILLIEKARQSGKPLVVEFGANSCATCRNMKPILDRVAHELKDKAQVIIVDLSTDYPAAEHFNIRMMPTQIFFNSQGQEISRHLGGLSQQEIVMRLGFNG